MKKRILPYLPIAICLCVWLLMPLRGYALEPVTFGQDNQNEFSFMGFLRNDSGMFIHSLPYQQNGNQLGVERTTARGYFDLKLGDEFSARLVSQFAYEPWYASEEGTTSSRVVYNEPTSIPRMERVQRIQQYK